MEEKEIKTGTGQRIAIGAIAVIMLFSIIASYAAIIVGGNKSSDSDVQELSAERMSYYQEKYANELAEFEKVSENDYKKFSPYLSEVKAYNEASANEGGVKVEDLVVGSGRTIGEKDGDYLAYYVGWCADETIFDSSLNDKSSPTAFAKALDVSLGMIEGWYQGTQGMKLGGVRAFTIPGELAYADQTEICGGFNKPLKFLVMAVPAEDPLKTAAAELDASYMMLQYANYGIDYEKEMAAQAENVTETTE